MVQTTDGFKIAEVILKLRGPGEFLEHSKVEFRRFALQILLMMQICLRWHAQKHSISSRMIRIYVKSRMNVFENIMKKSLEKFLSWGNIG